MRNIFFLQVCWEAGGGKSKSPPPKFQLWGAWPLPRSAPGLITVRSNHVLIISEKELCMICFPSSRHTDDIVIVLYYCWFSCLYTVATPITIFNYSVSDIKNPQWFTGQSILVAWKFCLTCFKPSSIYCGSFEVSHRLTVSRACFLMFVLWLWFISLSTGALTVIGYVLNVDGATYSRLARFSYSYHVNSTPFLRVSNM